MGASLSYPEIIQIVEDRFGLAYRNDKIRAAIPDPDYMPGELHRKLLDTRDLPWQAIVTTNIDTLIEATLREVGIAHTVVVRTSDFAKNQGIPVIKLHGTYEQEETWVFSESEYLNLEQDKAAFVSKIRTLFLENNCCFVGYSLADPDFMIGWNKYWALKKAYANQLML